MDQATLFSIFDLPRHVRSHYRRLVLVSRREHVAPGDLGDDETLIVSCDWLLWQELATQGRHCVYFELGLLDWPPDADLDNNLFIRAHDWIYAGGADDTLFHGVSLGRSFGGEVSMALMNICRLDRAIRSLIKRFRPQEIIYVDYINEISVVGNNLRRSIVAAAARDHQALLSFREGETSTAAPRIAEMLYAAPPAGRLKRALLGFYTRFLEAATNLRRIFSGPAPRVLVLVNSNLAVSLVDTFPGKGVAPMFFGQTIPKRLGQVWQCLRGAILLVTPQDGPLSQDDERVVGEIEAKLAAHPVNGDGPGRYIGDYVRQHILASGRLRERARAVVNAERLLARYRPVRLVVDGLRNIPVRFYVELAKTRGIAVDYLWHSPLTPQNQKLDALGGDPRISPLVDRCLSWGPINDQWLDVIGAKQPRVRIGSPVLGHYKGNGLSATPIVPPPAEANALVLQYTPVVTDVRALYSNMYAHFVDTVRLLRERGYRNVRFKLHPGPGRWKKSYFETIAGYFGLGCQVLKSEPFTECVAWADVVVGPAQTGAFLETLAAGKPYVATMLKPHGLDPSYYDKFYPVFDSVAAAVAAVDKSPPDGGRALLDAVWSVDMDNNCIHLFWNAVADAPGGRRMPDCAV